MPLACPWIWGDTSDRSGSHHPPDAQAQVARSTSAHTVEWILPTVLPRARHTATLRFRVLVWKAEVSTDLTTKDRCQF